jgi:hypothetical protein
VQAGRKEGLATLVLKDKANSKVLSLPIRLSGASPLSEPPHPVSLETQRIIAVLSTFVLIMLLVSIGTEKATDLIKMVLTSGKGKIKAPKPTFKEAMGADYKWLAALSPTQIDTVWALMCEPLNSAVDTLATVPSIKHLTEIVREDFNRQRGQTRWAWKWRLVAMVFGVVAAVAFNLDTLALLSPLMGSAFDATASVVNARGMTHIGGYLLTGFGASAGASFWQDFLDRLTKWKKAEQDAKL